MPGFSTPTLGDFALGLSFFTLLNLNFLTFCIKKTTESPICVPKPLKWILKHVNICKDKMVLNYQDFINNVLVLNCT